MNTNPPTAGVAKRVSPDEDDIADHAPSRKKLQSTDEPYGNEAPPTSTTAIREMLENLIFLHELRLTLNPDGQRLSDVSTSTNTSTIQSEDISLTGLVEPSVENTTATASHDHVDRLVQTSMDDHSVASGSIIAAATPRLVLPPQVSCIALYFIFMCFLLYLIVVYSISKSAQSDVTRSVIEEDTSLKERLRGLNRDIAKAKRQLKSCIDSL